MSEITINAQTVKRVLEVLLDERVIRGRNGTLEDKRVLNEASVILRILANSTRKRAPETARRAEHAADKLAAMASRTTVDQ